MLRLRDPNRLRTRSQQAQGTLGEELVMANHLQHLPTPRIGKGSGEKNERLYKP